MGLVVCLFVVSCAKGTGDRPIRIKTVTTNDYITSRNRINDSIYCCI